MREIVTSIKEYLHEYILDYLEIKLFERERKPSLEEKLNRVYEKLRSDYGRRT